MTEIQYDPYAKNQPAIAFGTEVYLRTFSEKERIPLNQFIQMRMLPTQRTNCDGCDGSWVAGTRPGTNDDGVERCDECELLDSDFDAASAVAEFLETHLPGLTPITVWYETEGARP